MAVVIPARDEAENLAPLIAATRAALVGSSGFEIIVVDDGSRDETPTVLAAIAAATPELRVIRHRVPRGQSAALLSAVRAARAPWIVTLDGDGQNDPSDIPALVARRDALGRRAILGHRQQRRDTFTKRAASRVANAVRAALLGDRTPDTGCGLKVFPRQAFLELPAFDHMHRFLPALFLRAGLEIVSVPVSHRQRRFGRSKYGIWGRLGVGILDLAGVLWLMRRPIAGAEERIVE